MSQGSRKRETVCVCVCDREIEIERDSLCVLCVCALDQHICDFVMKKSFWVLHLIRSTTPPSIGLCCMHRSLLTLTVIHKKQGHMKGHISEHMANFVQHLHGS